MPQFSQSSSFALAYSDVQQLLRFAPYLVRSQGQEALLHYSTPSGIWQGAPVCYSVVQGLFVLRWQGIVSKPEAHGFQVRAPQGPLGLFTAEHSFEAWEQSTLVRDQLVCENASYTDLFAQMRLIYSFDQRAEMARMQASAPTRALPRLDSGYAAG